MAALTAAFTTILKPARPVPLSLTVAGGLLTFIALIKLAGGLALLFEPAQVEWGEALILDHAARILRGEPLYQPIGETYFSVATYTPIYYYIVAGLRGLFGISLAPGRAVSLVASLVTVGMIAWVAGRRTGDRRAGVFAAALFVALGVPQIPATPWLALHKESMLGVCLGFAAIAILDGGVTPRRAVLAGVLASLAYLTKQTMIIALAAALPWLWFQDRRAALIMAGVAALLGGGVTLLLQLTTGSFFTGTVVATVNTFRADLFVVMLIGFTIFLGGATLATGLALLDRVRKRPALLNDIMVYYWVACLILIALTLPKLGSNQNHWMALGTPGAVLLAEGLWKYAGRPAAISSRRLWTWALILLWFNMLIALPHTVDTAKVARKLVRPDQTYLAEFHHLVDRVASSPGEVLADPQDVIALSGRTILTEPWAMSIVYSEHLTPWDPAPIINLICSGGVSMVVLDYTLENGGPYWAIPRWPAPVLEALRASMVLQSRTAGRYVYAYRAPAEGTICGS